jgi:hypothetical protein
MRFDELMAEAKTMFLSWKNDPVLTETYTEEELQKEFLKCIQHEIGSEFIILTKERLIQEKQKYFWDSYPKD